MIGRLLRRQTLASFDYQWKGLPEGGALLSDEWFLQNVERIVTDELLRLSPEWFRGKRVLDAGCGNGRWTVGLLKLGAKVHAVDSSPNALEHMRRNVAEFCSDEERSRLTDGVVDLLNVEPDPRAKRFDLVFSFGVLHHTGDTRRALAGIAPLVADDGAIFLYLYGKGAFAPKARVAVTLQRIALAPLPFELKKKAIARLHPAGDTHQLFDLLSPTINNRHTHEEVERWLRELGFADVVTTLEHSELFIRAARSAEALAPSALPAPSRPYWFERY